MENEETLNGVGGGVIVSFNLALSQPIRRCLRP